MENTKIGSDSLIFYNLACNCYTFTSCQPIWQQETAEDEPNFYGSLCFDSQIEGNLDEYFEFTRVASDGHLVEDEEDQEFADEVCNQQHDALYLIFDADEEFEAMTKRADSDYTNTTFYKNAEAFAKNWKYDITSLSI